MRTFYTGATRDDDEKKLDYEGFISPIVLRKYAEYMQKHQTQADGEVRTSDNWQNGIPKDAYMKSLLRHVMDAWLEHDGQVSREGMNDALCGILFNTMGYLYEVLRDESTETVEHNCFTCVYETAPEQVCRRRGCHRAFRPAEQVGVVLPDRWESNRD